MSTLVATYHYYRPTIPTSFKNPFLLVFYWYHKGLESTIVRYRRFLAAEVSTRKVAYLEKTAVESDGQEASPDAKEVSLLNYSGGGSDGDDPDKNGKKGIRGKLNKKNGMIGGAIGGGIFTIIFGMAIAFPGFIVTQIGDIISNVGKVQLHNDRRYHRSNFHKMTDLFSRDGRLGGKMLNEMGRAGYDISFDPKNPNKIVGITRPGAAVSATGAGLSDELIKFQDARHPFRLASFKTRRMEAFYKRYGVTRKSLVTSTGGVGRASPDAIADINKRLKATTDGTSVDTTVRVDADNEGLTDEEIAERDRVASTPATNSGAFKDLDAWVKEGKDLDEFPDQKLVRAWRQSAQLIQPEILGFAEDASRGGSLGGKAFSAIKGFGLSTDIADKLCTIKKRLRVAVVAARVYRNLALLRTSYAYMTAPDGVRKGEAQADLLKQVMKRIVAKDYNGNYIGSSSGFSSVMKGTFSKSRNDVTRSGIAVDGRLTGALKTIQQETDIEGCSVWQNPFFQVGIAGLEIVVGIFTGGSSKAATEAAAKATGEAVKSGFKAAIKRAITSQIAKSIAKSVLIEISFEGIMTLTQIYAERSLSANFMGQEKGGELGDMLIAGAGSASKQRSLSNGQVPSTTDEYAMEYTRYLAEKKQEIAEKSVIARIFDRSDPDSLVFSTASQVAVNMNTPELALSSIQAGALSYPAKLASTFMNFGGGRTYAADGDQIAFDTLVVEGNNSNSGKKLATDMAGNLLTRMPDEILMIDPEPNRDELINLGYVDKETNQPIGDFAKHVENCVDSVDTISQIETGDPTDVTQDCLASQLLTRKFKAHLAYLGMTDNLEAEFFPEEISSGGGTSTSATSPVTNTGSSAKYIPDCSVNNGNAGIACTAIDELLGIPYSREQRASPTTVDPVPFLDCSAFTGMAVYRTFGVNLQGIASVDYRNNPNFENLTDIRDIQPGDLVGKGTVASGAGGTGHIAVVVSYDSTTQKLITAETDRKTLPSRVVTTKGLEVDGKGNYSWAVRYIGPKNSGSQ